MFFLLPIEFGLFGANLPKIPQRWLVPAGGRRHRLRGAVHVEERARALLFERLKDKMYPFEQFLKDIARKPPHRVSGTSVFMTSNVVGTPPTLLHNLLHNKVLHDHV